MPLKTKHYFPEMRLETWAMEAGGGLVCQESSQPHRRGKKQASGQTKEGFWEQWVGGGLLRSLDQPVGNQNSFWSG